MQSKTTRGVRRLLVSTGVISLVLSVAAPAALADKPAENERPRNLPAGKAETGTTRTLVCHEGGVLEVDDDGALGGHTKHGDPVIEVNEGEEEPEPGDQCDMAPETGPVSGGSGSELEEDGTDPTLEGEEDSDENESDDDAHADDSDEDGDETGGPGNSDGTTGGGNDGNPTDEDSKDDDGNEVIAEVEDEGETSKPKPIHVVISTDTVTAPKPAPAAPAAPVVPATPAIPATPQAPATPATPASPAAAPTAKPVATSSDTAPQVLGSVTTRTPGGGTVTTLAATGLDSTTILVIVGTTLLLSGVGLELLGRKRATAEA